MLISNFTSIYEFLAIVATILKKVIKIRQFLKIKVYSGIQERIIGAITYPFQTYQIGLVEGSEYLPVKEKNIVFKCTEEEVLLEDFDFERYKITFYLDVNWKDKVLKNQNCQTNGRIWAITELTIDIKEKMGSWEILINANNYLEEIQNNEIFQGVKKCLEIEDHLVRMEECYLYQI